MTNLLTEEPYHSGFKNLGVEILDALYLNDYSRALLLFNAWWAFVEKNSVVMERPEGFKAFEKEKIGGTLIYPNEQLWISSSNLDSIPMNILIRDDGLIKIIDLEWKTYAGHCPAQLLIDRGMNDIMLRLCRLRRIEQLSKTGQWNLPVSFLKELPDRMIRPELPSLRIFDRWFQSMILDKNSVLSTYQCELLTRKACREERMAKIFGPFKRLLKKAISRVAVTQIFKLIAAVTPEIES